MGVVRVVAVVRVSVRKKMHGMDEGDEDFPFNIIAVASIMP